MRPPRSVFWRDCMLRNLATATVLSPIASLVLSAGAVRRADGRQTSSSGRRTSRCIQAILNPSASPSPNNIYIIIYREQCNILIVYFIHTLIHTNINRKVLLMFFCSWFTLNLILHALSVVLKKHRLSSSREKVVFQR